MSIIPWIHDRTKEDVEYARAQKRELDQLKGTQGYIAWNRLTQNMYYLASLFNIRGYKVALTCRTNFNDYTFPYENEVIEIRNDLALLRSTLNGLTNFSWNEWNYDGFTWKQVNDRQRDTEGYFSNNPIPQLPWTYFEKINDVEEIGSILENTIDSIKQLYRISGTFYAGQVNYLPKFIDQEIPSGMLWWEWNGYKRSWRTINNERNVMPEFFNRPKQYIDNMTWDEWNIKRRTWTQINTELRTAKDYFKRV